MVAVISSKPKHQKVTGNKVFKSWNPGILKDTIHYQPGEAALIANHTAAGYSFITEDFYDKRLSAGGPAYAGAVEGDKLLPQKTNRVPH